MLHEDTLYICFKALLTGNYYTDYHKIQAPGIHIKIIGLGKLESQTFGSD